MNLHLPPAESRLESAIRRLTAQRDILDLVCLSVPAEGPVIELGLGNGRTYDHLRARLPGRRIIAFDRALGAHASSTPASGDLVLGEIEQTAAAYAGIGAALVHSDIGSGYDDRDAKTLTWLPRLAASLVRDGGLVVSDLRLDHPRLEPQALPACVPPGRYHLYRAPAAGELKKQP